MKRPLKRQVLLGVVLALLIAAGIGPRLARRSPGQRAWVLAASAWGTGVDGSNRLQALREKLRRERPGDHELQAGRSAAPVSDPGRAIRDASRYLIASGGGSILLVTDGQDPFHDAIAALEDAARNGVTVDLLPLEANRSDLAIEALELPPVVRAGELFEALALVRSSSEQTVEVSLERDGRQVARASARLQPGSLHGLSFLVSAGQTSATWVAHVAASVPGQKSVDSFGEPSAGLARRADDDISGIFRGGPTQPASSRASETDKGLLTRDTREGGSVVDTLPANDVAQAYLRVAGAPRLATVGFPGLAERADRHDRLPSSEMLERYEALFLRIDGASLPSEAEQTELARWVREGHGLVVSCDDPELALRLRGGPLEALLPVRLEPPEPEDERSAIVLLVDRSGSMDQSAAARNTHGAADGTALDSAFGAAEAMLTLLGPEDRFGLIAFDVEPHVLRPLAMVGRETAAQAPTPEPAGGTDWGAALGLALDWLETETLSRRHIVLVGDGILAPGADGDPGRDWPDGITLSTVSVGERAEQQHMARLAMQYGGEHRHVTRPDDLPAALRKEGARLRPPQRRSGPLSIEAAPRFVGLVPSVSIGPQQHLLATRPLPDAELALHSSRGDVVLAFRQVGWGRVGFLAADPAALTSEQGNAQGNARARLALSALERVLPSGDSQDGVDVTFDGRRAIVEWRLAEGQAAWPSGRVRSADGQIRPLRPERDGPLRARAIVVPLGPGRTVIETAGGHWSLWPNAQPEQRLPPQAGDWPERWAVAGGGVVRTLDDAGPRRPPASSRRARLSSAPWLIALAACIACVDLCLQRMERS